MTIITFFLNHECKNSGFFSSTLRQENFLLKRREREVGWYFLVVFQDTELRIGLSEANGDGNRWLDGFFL
jgi:hypothetical protein